MTRSDPSYWRCSPRVVGILSLPTRSTQLCIPLGSLNRVSALLGVKVGSSHLLVSGMLCDPIWHVSSCSDEASCKLLYSVYFTFRYLVVEMDICVMLLTCQKHTVLTCCDLPQVILISLHWTAMMTFHFLLKFTSPMSHVLHFLFPRSVVSQVTSVSIDLYFDTWMAIFQKGAKESHGYQEVLNKFFISMTLVDLEWFPWSLCCWRHVRFSI